MPAPLYPFQKVGVDWLSARKVGILADEMGLGKTPQAIGACDDVLANRLLIVCPAVARVAWQRAFSKFSCYTRPFTLVMERRTPVPDQHSIITSYENAVFHCADWRARLQPFDALIFDEGHYLKSAEARRSAALLGQKGLVHHAQRTWVLTGTPMPNGHPGELWLLLRVFGRTKLGYEDFTQRYCEFAPGFRNYTRIVGTRKDRVDEVKALLEPVMLRRTVAEVLPDLPPLRYEELAVEADQSVYIPPELIERAAQEERWLVEQAQSMGPTELLGVLELLAKSVSTLRLLNGLKKIQPVADLIREELELGLYPKIVIFAVHKRVVKELLLDLAPWHSVGVYGDLSPTERQKNIDRFQTDPRCQVIVCNIQAAGTAIDLTAANQLLFVESEWSPAAMAQAAKRVHRIGQTREVLVRFASVHNTIDQKITGVIRRKTRDLNLLLT